VIYECYVRDWKDRERHYVEPCWPRPFRARRKLQERARLLALREAERELGLEPWQFGSTRNA
jgi:hypothetical protein